VHTVSVISSTIITGFGIRAKRENFVHHASDIVDLTHDRVGALLEYATILGDRIAVFAPQPLGPKAEWE